MIKRRFARTNRRKYTTQLAAAEIRERSMRGVKQRIINHTGLSQVHQHQRRPRKQPQAESDDEDTVISSNSTQHYNIAETTKERENILEWLYTNRSDVAMKVRVLRTVAGVNTDTIIRTLFQDSKIIF